MHKTRQEPVPNCMWPVNNAKIKPSLKLMEHTVVDKIEAPIEMRRNN